MRRAAIPSILIALALLAVGVIAEAQQPAKIPRVGILFIGGRDQPHLEVFKQGLRERGYTEGKNIVLDYRYAEGNVDRLPSLAAELVQLNVDPRWIHRRTEHRHRMALTIQPWEVRDADDFEKVFAVLNKHRPDGLYALGAGPLMRANLKRIVGSALKSRLPSMYGNRGAIDAGGLIWYPERRI